MMMMMKIITKSSVINVYVFLYSMSVRACEHNNGNVVNDYDVNSEGYTSILITTVTRVEIMKISI